ncbi:DNA-directed RNA polymerase III subunit rpc1 [Sphaceloma murrayae]|uniref:DNA-directed RNA polymerase III subunit rpc1 n=1 Tax=Sphaceloma murrayae TaxID=2082308 RepID=A0A2K1QLR1_9PEZI|nr:DNA-directed RNA polymerase III subunit rpc1 [Sphaceloma murrayae]
MFSSIGLLGALAGTVAAGNILWDGRFNDLTSSADLEKWSWANQVGPYQYYIHGSGPVTSYVNLASDFKNPADTGSSKGVKLTIDNTAHWNGQPMFRTELIPQTKAAINSGKVYYHFSLMTTATNPPSPTEEHQINFFESHFVEMMYGQNGGSNNTLRFATNGQAQWAAELKAGEWHNCAYEIDFSAKTVAFYHSNGDADLTLQAGPMSASTSSNGQDFHLGVLRLPGSTTTGTTEDWFFSGVYVESGPLNTKVASPGGSAADSTTPAQLPASSAAAPSSTQEPTSVGSATPSDSQTSPAVTEKTSVAASTLPSPDPVPTTSGYSSEPASVPVPEPSSGYTDAPATSIPVTTSAPATTSSPVTTSAPITTAFPQPSAVPLPTDSTVPSVPLPSFSSIITLSTFSASDIPGAPDITNVVSAIPSASLTASVSLTLTVPTEGYDPVPSTTSPLPSDAPKPKDPISQILPQPSTPCTTLVTVTATRNPNGPSGGLPIGTGGAPYPIGGGGSATRSPVRPTGGAGGYRGGRRRPWWYRAHQGRPTRGGYADNEAYEALVQRLKEMEAESR